MKHQQRTLEDKPRNLLDADVECSVRILAQVDRLRFRSLSLEAI